MKPRPFLLERYFAEHEFSTPYLLSCSDCEPLALSELLELADDESRRLWDSLRLGYTESQGHPLLRAEVAKLHTRISPEQVLTCVPEEGILLAMSVLLRPGDHVVTTFPGYQSLYEIARAIGCRVDRWTPHQAGGGWRFDLVELEDLLREETRLLVINFPHNPTGATISAEDLARIVRLARRYGAYLFSDEMYRLLEHDPGARLPAACDEYERAVSLGGMSKAFALAGLRIGWLATQDADLLAQLAAYRDYTTICSSAPSEVLAIMGLRAQEAILARNMAIIRCNLSLLEAFFARHTDPFSWPRPRAGSIAFPRLLRGDADRFCADLVREAGVLLLPGSVYEFNRACFRVGYGRANLPRALERLEAFIDRRSD